MTVTSGPMDGLLLIEPRVFSDDRGWFLETWNRARYRELGIDEDFVQDNLSHSRKGVIRGLHFQNPNPQAKLVQVLEGEVFDVVLDLRKSSATFGRWTAMNLSAANRKQLFVPAGFAHGFAVLSEFALFHYKCSHSYSPGDECTLRWDDPAIGIEWPVPAPILSDKDRSGLLLRDLPASRLFS